MKILLLAAVSAALCAQAQSIDFSSLDKLADKAEESNTISLDQNQLRAALQMLPADKENAQNLQQLRKLVSGLTGITVHSLEFDGPGKYRDSDLQPIRTQISKLPGASKIVDSKEKDEHSEIYMLMDGEKPAGMAIISAEETDLSVVLIRGALGLRDLGSIGAVMSIPNMRLGPQQASSANPKK